MDSELIYITCPDLDIARNIVRHLLDKKLIACGNILPTHESHYLWKGKIEVSSEHIVILKTLNTKFKAIENEILTLHPYETPCILSLSVNESHNAFTDWIKTSVE